MIAYSRFAGGHAFMNRESSKTESRRFDMKCLRKKSDRISERVFVTLKYLLSVLSIVLTSAFVVALETRV